MILHNATVDTILERRSVRSYAPQQITPDELETILEAGRSAPSGMNQQSAIAVAVQSKAELAQLVELAKAAAHQDHNPFYDAPTVILVFAKMTNLATHGGRLYGDREHASCREITGHRYLLDLCRQCSVCF